MHVGDLYVQRPSDEELTRFSFPVDDQVTWVGEVFHKDALGTELPLQLEIFPLRDPRKKDNREAVRFGAYKLSLREQNALMESLEQQARRLQAAVEVARVTIAQHDLDSLLTEVALVTQHLFEFDFVAVGLVENNRVHVRAVINAQNSHTRVFKHFDIDDTSMTGYAASTGKPLLTNNTQLERRYRYQAETPNIRSEMVVPMKLGGRVIGTFGVGSANADALTAGDLETFQGIADQVAVAIENLQLLAAQRRRLLELGIVNDISLMLVASSYDLDPLWGPIFEHLRSLFTLSTFYVMLYDAASDMLRFAYLVDMGKVISFKQPIPVAGLSSLVIRGGKVVRFDDLQRDQDRLAQEGLMPMHIIANHGYTRSWLGVPLRARDDNILGLISIQSYEPNIFTESDERLLSTIAALVSLALENSRLFVRLRLTAARLEKRTHRLEMLAKLGTILSSSLDRDFVLAQAAEHIYNLMDVDHCGIVLLDPTREFGEVVAEYPPMELLNSHIPLMGNPVYELHRKQDVIVFDTAVEQGELRELLVSQGIKTMVVVRMIGKDRLLGSIGLDMMTRHREFTDEDFDLFRIIVHQVALTVENTDLYSRALAINELKNEFLANMSHELRTPMNAIIGYTEMVLAGLYGPLTGTQQDRLQRVYGNAKHLLELINDVLDLARIEADHLKLDIAPVDVVPLVISAVGNIAPIAEAKQLRISIELPHQEVIIAADGVRLRQIMLNLLSNAVKFTREGGITVKVYTFAIQPHGPRQTTPPGVVLPDGQWMAIAVQDTGIGIAAKDHEVIFEAFRQLDGSSVKEYAGTGLGLSISRELAELHRGQIWVESQVGVGSTFTVVLPMTPLQ
jgi:signal transduction histidine kinase